MVDVKLLRVKADHMTQTELSKKSGVNRTTISAVENGHQPSVRVAVKLARILGIDWREFYEP